MKDESFDLFYNTVKRIFTTVGFDIPHHGWKVVNTKFVISYFIVISHLYVSTIFIVNNIDSLILVTECASVTATGIQTFIKCTLLFCYRDAWTNIFELIREQRAEFIDKYDNLMRSHTNRAMWCVRSLYSIYLLVTIGFAITPIFQPGPKQLPLSFNIPHLPYEENPYYTINYIHHITDCLLASHLVTGTDGITLIVFVHAYCRFDIMVEIINELKILINQKMSSHDMKNEIDLKLKSLYTEHFKTIQFINYCQTYCSMMFLAQVLTDTMIICMSLNVIATTSSKGCIIFLLAGAFQHFITCFFGNYLIVKNDNFVETIYSLDWYKMTVEQQKCFLIIFHNAQRPCEIDAMFFKINLSNFLMVIKTSYSYYTLLQNMDD